MSLYNNIYGVHPASFFLMPMLGKRHPDDYPRFRDCFPGKMTRGINNDKYGIPERLLSDDYVITVFTRTGGGNRSHYSKENSALEFHPEYISNHDDTFDSTFAHFIFKVPDKHLEDFKLIQQKDLKKVSIEYKEQIIAMFPKIHKQLIDILY